MLREEIKKWKREIALALIIGFSLFIAIFTIVWSRQPDFRPLVQDLRLTDAVKISDILDQQSVRYYADIKSHILYVDRQHIIEAKIGLAKAGIVIDYPNIKLNEDLNESFEQLEAQMKDKKLDAPLYQQDWFQPLVKLISSMFVIITLILGVVRPALKALIYPNDEE